jgi:hypothetical protein
MEGVRKGATKANCLLVSSCTRRSVHLLSNWVINSHVRDAVSDLVLRVEQQEFRGSAAGKLSATLDTAYNRTSLYVVDVIYDYSQIRNNAVSLMARITDAFARTTMDGKREGMYLLRR